jgi:RNA polymerase sigma-70 factor (ECF subfamily)
MIPVNRVVAEIPARLDPESAEWIRVLAVAGPRREAALARLHGMLLRIAQREARRRGPRLLIVGPELEDVAYQAAADALMAITGKLSQFRGESRFTTWMLRRCCGATAGRAAGSSRRTCGGWPARRVFASSAV